MKKSETEMRQTLSLTDLTIYLWASVCLSESQNKQIINYILLLRFEMEIYFAVWPPLALSQQRPPPHKKTKKKGEAGRQAGDPIYLLRPAQGLYLILSTLPLPPAFIFLDLVRLLFYWGFRRYRQPLPPPPFPAPHFCFWQLTFLLGVEDRYIFTRYFITNEHYERRVVGAFVLMQMPKRV